MYVCMRVRVHVRIYIYICECMQVFVYVFGCVVTPQCLYCFSFTFVGECRGLGRRFLLMQEWTNLPHPQMVVDWLKHSFLSQRNNVSAEDYQAIRHDLFCHLAQRKVRCHPLFVVLPSARYLFRRGGNPKDRSFITFSVASAKLGFAPVPLACVVRPATSPLPWTARLPLPAPHPSLKRV